MTAAYWSTGDWFPDYTRLVIASDSTTKVLILLNLYLDVSFKEIKGIKPRISWSNTSHVGHCTLSPHTYTSSFILQ